jgi:lipopolysaccharide export system protein LptC
VNGLTTQIDRGSRHSFVANRRDTGRVFRAAMRHSRMVRVLRIAIPIIIGLAGVGTIVLFKWLDPLRVLAKLPVNSKGLVVSGTKITMQQPHLVGFTKDSRPYSVTARTAAQDITNPDAVELQDIYATMATQDQGRIEVTARNGFYDGKTENLTLRNNIVLTSPTYIARLQQAVVGVRIGHVVSEQPVEVQMLQGTINANRLEVVDSGKIIRFQRGVDMVLQPQGPPKHETAGSP